MKYSEKSTAEIGHDLVRAYFWCLYIGGCAAGVVATAPIWLTYHVAKEGAALCVKKAAKMYEQHEENRGEPKNHNHHNHHRFHLFHHSKNKENYDAPPSAALAYQHKGW